MLDVGKTSLLRKFVTGKFIHDPNVTSSANFLNKQVYTTDNTMVKLDLWDTAGQEVFRSLAPLYYRNADVTVVMYDVSEYFQYFKNNI
jgi:small GTP-binding protein